MSAPAFADFRSDTVTRPCPAMREAMLAAPVGDDVFGDDPTVHALEAAGAALLGKEAALLLPSGTMANQAAVRVWCRPGDEALLHRSSHVYRYEQGGLAALHGVQAVPLPGERGLLDPAELARHVRGDDPHLPRTRLVVSEDTHNMEGGLVLPLDGLRSVHEFARSHGLKHHLDGARVMNAAVASQVPVHEIAACADSITLCLSKGLGAPVGTLLAGEAGFIARARRVRKLLGGGMRQAGILAAAARHALEHNIERLAQDHALAASLSERLAALGYAVVAPETNILIVEGLPEDTGPFVEQIRRRDVAIVPFGAHRVRVTTHKDVGEEQAARLVEAFAEHGPPKERA